MINPNKKIIYDRNYFEMYKKYQEGYSLSEVGKLFGLTKETVRIGFRRRGYIIRKNKIYVSEDGETFSFKLKNGKITRNEYKDILAKNKGFKNRSEYVNYLINKNGFEDSQEYKNFIAKKSGFKDCADRLRYYRYKNGINLPMSENRECSSFLGIYIAENALSKIFENVQRMSNNNRGYDFICDKGYKIDVKSSCLYNDKGYTGWGFHIDNNKIADYFLLLAFDSRKDLNPLHIWLIKGDSIIGGKKKKICEYMKISITNNINSIKKYNKYELKNKLYILNEIIKNNGGNIESISG